MMKIKTVISSIIPSTEKLNPLVHLRSYLDVLEILVYDGLERVDEVLLHVDIQGILYFSQPFHSLPHVNKSTTYSAQDTSFTLSILML